MGFIAASSPPQWSWCERSVREVSDLSGPRVLVSRPTAPSSHAPRASTPSLPFPQWKRSLTFLPSSTMFYDCHSLSFCLGTPRPPRELSLSKARRLLHLALLASRWVDTALSGIASRMFLIRG